MYEKAKWPEHKADNLSAIYCRYWERFPLLFRFPTCIYGAPGQNVLQFVPTHSIRLLSAFPNQVFHIVPNYTEICCVTATTPMANIKLIDALKFCLHNTIYITVRNSNTPLLISVSLKSRNCLDECHFVTLNYTKTATVDILQ